jgi:exosortase
MGSSAPTTLGLALGGMLVVAGNLGVVFGGAGVRHFGMAFGFLLIAMPVPSGIQGPIVGTLQNKVAWFNTEVLNLLGIPATQVGSLIHLPAGTVGVDEACSGIRSLQSTIMATLFIGYLTLNRFSLQVLLFLCGISLAILGNLIRSLYLSLTANARGIEAIAGVHDAAGWSILTFTAVGVIIISWFFKKLERQLDQLEAVPEPEPESPPPGPRRLTSCRRRPRRRFFPRATPVVTRLTRPRRAFCFFHPAFFGHSFGHARVAIATNGPDGAAARLGSGGGKPVVRAALVNRPDRDAHSCGAGVGGAPRRSSALPPEWRAQRPRGGSRKLRRCRCRPFGFRTRPARRAADFFRIAENGRARCRIVQPAGASRALQATVRAFQTYLKLATGADLPVVTETPGDASGQPAIHVGDTQRARAVDLGLPDLDYGGDRFPNRRGYLIRTPDRHTLIIRGATDAGTAHGVVGFSSGTWACARTGPGRPAGWAMSSPRGPRSRCRRSNGATGRTGTAWPLPAARSPTARGRRWIFTGAT